MKTAIESDAGVNRILHFTVGLVVLATSFVGTLAAVRFLMLP